MAQESPPRSATQGSTPSHPTIDRQNRQLHQYWTLSNILRLNRQNALVRRLVRMTQDGALNSPDRRENYPVNDDDETVQFGDNIIHQPPSNSSVVPWVLAAALGGALAVPLMQKLLTPTTPTPIVDTDTDTRNTIRPYVPRETK